MRPSGTAYAWTYLFYSPSKDLETEVTINPLEVAVDTSAAPSFLAEMNPIPDGFVDSDVALQTTLEDGGQEFVDQYPPRNLTTILTGGNLFWTEAPDTTEEFWRVRLIGESGSTVETFERYINMETGDVLPVELTRLTASAVGSGVQLRWRTASETNNAGFEVQHAAGDSSAGSAWTRLGFVESKARGGTTTEPRAYRFRAKELTPGSHRFRLRQVDLDGSAELTDVVRVTLRLRAALRLTKPSPNPVRQQATLRFGAKDAASATVAVYDALGRRVRTLWEGPLSRGQMRAVRLDASRLPSGVYFVRARAEDQTKTRKLTVVK